MKTIERTITSYKHIFGKIEKTEQGMVITDTKALIFDKTYNPTSRVLNKAMEEHGIKGYSLVSIESVEQKYRMPVEDFIKFAEVVE